MKRIELATCGLVTINQAAERMSVNQMTIRNWIARDLLPVVVIPGERESYLIRERDLVRVKPPTMGRPALPAGGQRPKKGKRGVKQG